MESTRGKLINLLERNEKTFISGQTLSEALNISRNAVWKHMKELEKDGYIIEARPKAGYRIVGFPDKLSENTIRWGLETEWMGSRIIHEESVTSTQKIAHEAARNGAPHGTIVLADEQTEGKGRMNRSWHSGRGKGMWLTILLRPEILPQNASQLTLLTATVLADLLSSYEGIHPQIKWPNDILLGGRKAAGILTEMQAEQDRVQYLLIGIGLNVNQHSGDLPEELQTKAASMSSVTGKNYSIKRIIQQLLLEFEQAYKGYLQDGFGPYKEKWENYGFKIGKKIHIRTLKESWSAPFLGISEDGALLTLTSEGTETKVYSADIDWFGDQ